MKIKRKLVSIIIVNWNGGEVFRECLRSLKNISYSNWELIVVDNGSSDGSRKLVNSLKFSVDSKLVVNSDNIGFALANNQGLEKARGDYILLLNNDTKVAPNLLEVLVEKMESELDLGVVQPKILLMDKKGYIDNAGSFLTRTGFLEHWGYMAKDSEEFDEEREIFSAKGACMLIRKKVIDRVGLFDSDFGSYFEESDFCWRVWLGGARVLYYPKTHIYHKVGFTSKKMDQVRVTMVSTRNRLCSILKNLSSVNLFLILMPHIGFVILLGTYYLARFQVRKAWMMYGSLWWTMIHLPKLIVKRVRVQRLRVKSDGELFEIIMKPVDVKRMLNHFRKVESNFR